MEVVVVCVVEVGIMVEGLVLEDRVRFSAPVARRNITLKEDRVAVVEGHCIREVVVNGGGSVVRCHKSTGLRYAILIVVVVSKVVVRPH